MALITETNLEQQLQRSVTDNTAGSVAWILDAASALVESYLGQSIEAATYTDEPYDGPGIEALWLNHTPVTAVSDVKVHGETVPTEDYTWTTGGRLLRVNGDIPVCWTDRRGAITVTYDAGYTAGNIPNAVVVVATQSAARMFEVAKTLAATADTLGIEQVTLEASDAVKYTSSVNRIAMLTAGELTAAEKNMLDSTGLCQGFVA